MDSILNEKKQSMVTVHLNNGELVSGKFIMAHCGLIVLSCKARHIDSCKTVMICQENVLYVEIFNQEEL